MCNVGTQVQVLVLVQVLTQPLVFLPAGSDSAGFGRSYWTLLHFLSHDSWWGFYFLFPELVFQNESLADGADALQPRVARCTAASFQQRPWWREWVLHPGRVLTLTSRFFSSWFQWGGHKRIHQQSP